MRDSINIQDPIYGNFIISEKVLVDLLNSSTIERLKNIHQAGATYLVRDGRDGTRYEHSVGVMLLIRILGGSIEEQVAGLLHDISHTAFSHVIDQVFSNKKETFHEEYKSWFLNSSDVPKILSKYNLDTDYIFDEHNWKILEQPQPYLCADRVDYTLRDLYGIGKISKKEIDSFVDSIELVEGRMVLNDLEASKWFTEQYFIEVTELFMNPIEIFANNHLALAIRMAMEKEILTLSDMLLKNDNQVLEKIQASRNEKILSKLNDLNKNIQVTRDLENFDYQGFSKPRIVNPLTLDSENNVVLCSELYPSIIELHQRVKTKATEGIFVKLVKN